MQYEQFNALLAPISSDLAARIADARKLEGQEAILALYTSALYAALEQEETKLWQYSTEALYSLGNRALVKDLNRYITTRQENTQT
jgi:hypothetical protein